MDHRGIVRYRSHFVPGWWWRGKCRKKYIYIEKRTTHKQKTTRRLYQFQFILLFRCWPMMRWNLNGQMKCTLFQQKATFYKTTIYSFVLNVRVSLSGVDVDVYDDEAVFILCPLPLFFSGNVSVQCIVLLLHLLLWIRMTPLLAVGMRDYLCMLFIIVNQIFGLVITVTKLFPLPIRSIFFFALYVYSLIGW